MLLLYRVDRDATGHRDANAAAGTVTHMYTSRLINLLGASTAVVAGALLLASWLTGSQFLLLLVLMVAAIGLGAEPVARRWKRRDT